MQEEHEENGTVDIPHREHDGGQQQGAPRKCTQVGRHINTGDLRTRSSGEEQATDIDVPDNKGN